MSICDQDHSYKNWCISSKYITDQNICCLHFQRIHVHLRSSFLLQGNLVSKRKCNALCFAADPDVTGQLAVRLLLATNIHQGILSEHTLGVQIGSQETTISLELRPRGQDRTSVWEAGEVEWLRARYVTTADHTRMAYTTLCGWDLEMSSTNAVISARRPFAMHVVDAHSMWWRQHLLTEENDPCEVWDQPYSRWSEALHVGGGHYVLQELQGLGDAGVDGHLQRIAHGQRADSTHSPHGSHHPHTIARAMYNQGKLHWQPARAQGNALFPVFCPHRHSPNTGEGLERTYLHSFLFRIRILIISLQG